MNPWVIRALAAGLLLMTIGGVVLAMCNHNPPVDPPAVRPFDPLY